MFITRLLWLDGETEKDLLSHSAVHARDQVDRQESASKHLSRRLSRTRSEPLRHRLLASTLKRVA
jgi:hypothetical protein